MIGGGNSGVEAAIDLAGLAAEVTLLEFDTKTAARRFGVREDINGRRLRVDEKR